MEKLSAPRRAFLTGNYFTRKGRARLAVELAETGRDPPGSVTLLSANCLGWQGMTCLGCKEVCPETAIELQAGLEPKIDMKLCSHCGRCVEVCPTSAIHISMLQAQ